MENKHTPVFDGQRLKALRQERGLRAQVVARRAGVSVRHVWRLEANARPNVAGVTLGRLALALDTTVEYLLGLTDDPRGLRREGVGDGTASTGQ
ncbi:MAG: helix-turn-helix transcriptional regulator [Chloroflexi bacterium]|nr:helix-turn-helix transcriptional regulator [Chloroflexota bacterium]